MKIHVNIKILVSLIMAGCLWLSCGGDDTVDPSEQDLAFERLVGAWTLGASGSITLDGQDVSLNYPGFSLSFADGTYQTTNSGDLFSASGTWQWTNEQAGALLLDSGVEVTIIELTESRFQFSFTHNGGGEAAGTSGSYIITVIR